jgi:hypothetical protein
VRALLLSLKKKYMARSWWTGQLVVAVVPVRILVWVERAGNAAVAVAAAVVVGMRADTEFAEVDMCGKMKVRVDVGSEAVDVPFRLDSGTTVVPSASGSAGIALS